MMKRLLGIVVLGTLLLVLPHCAKYSPSPLPHPVGEEQEKSNIKIVTRKLSAKECAACFDEKSVSKKYDVIQLYVKNKNKKPIVLSANNISVPVESSKDVCHKIHRNTAGRVAAYGAGAFFLWPLIIPAAVDGAKSSTANHRINRDVAVKVLGQNETEIIQPHNSVNKVIFVPKRYSKNEIDVKLINKSSKETVCFTCNVR